VSSLKERLLVRPVEAWSRFWFAPTTARQNTRVRVAICLVAALWFFSFLGLESVEKWFGADGILNHSLSARLIEFEETPRWQHWSPLWWTQEVLVYQAWLAAGIVLSILAALGIGGRAVLAVLIFVSIGWIHRITWLQGPIEPALVAMLGYLFVAPGERLFQSNAPRSTSWLNGVAARLIQTHWWILVASGLLMQLGSIVWWRGEAVWWLAASEHSNFLAVESLRSRPVLVNGLTHAMIAIQLIALWLLTIPSARPYGFVAGLLVAFSIGLIGDQLLYGLLLASGLLAWSDEAPEQFELNSDTAR
jgi:hypothetical protein